MEIINSLLVIFTPLALVNLYYGPFGNFLERLFLTNVQGYTSPCHYDQYGQLFQGPSLFLILLILVLASRVIVDDVRSGIGEDAKVTYAKNRMNTGSSLVGDVGDNGSAIVGAKNKIDIGLGLRRDIRDNRSAVVDVGNRMDAR